MISIPRRWWLSRWNFSKDHPEAGGVLTEAVIIDQFGRPSGNILFPDGLGINGNATSIDFYTLFRALLRHANFLVCPSAMVRSDIYKNEIKVWRGDLFGSSADLDVWLRIARRSHLGLLPFRLMGYRLSNHQHSAKVRYQTERADFFRVIDYYLNSDDILAHLTDIDNENYKKLIRRDNIVRASNFFLIGDFSKTDELLNNFFELKVFVSAMADKRGLAVFLLGLYLKLTNIRGLRKLAQAGLRKLKQFWGK